MSAEAVVSIVPGEFNREMIRFDDEFRAFWVGLPAEELLLAIPAIKVWNRIQGLMAGKSCDAEQRSIDELAAKLHAKLRKVTS